MSLFKRGLEFHKQLHQHVFARRTDINDVSQPRVGQPIDLTIKFIQASGIPKMDHGPNGLADPYFIANIDGKISYVSTPQPRTLTPVWNEVWMVANVPSDAKLRVDVYDKDEGQPTDDYVGSFTTWIDGGAQVQPLKSLIGNEAGTFGFQITAEPSQHTNIPQYSFNGPIRYARHFSPTAGVLTKIGNPNGSLTRLWSTWKMAMKGISIYFEDHHQHWNVNYKAAQAIFQGPLSFTVRAPIQAGHHLLYARSTRGTFGTINDADGFWALFRAGDGRLPADPLLAQRRSLEESRIKPAVYTYIIGDDDNFRFSETGASFFVDFASKHALHSCCSETVRYSGEFHPRPFYPDGSGWSSFSEETKDHEVEWELVIDNNSGTYAPDKNLLPALKGLFEYNFQGLKVVAWDFKDNETELEASRKACREYALKNRGVTQNQLQPSMTITEQVGGTSLFHAVTDAQSANTAGPSGVATAIPQDTPQPENTLRSSTTPRLDSQVLTPSQSQEQPGKISSEIPGPNHAPVGESSALPLTSTPTPLPQPQQQPPVPDDLPPPYEESSQVPYGPPGTKS